MRFAGEILLAWLAAVVETALPGLFGLGRWRPLLAPVVAARLGLVTGPLEGGLLTVVTGLIHEAVTGLPTGSSTFGLALVQVSTRLVTEGLGLSGRGVEVAAGAAGVGLWQVVLFVVERLLGPVDGAPSLSWAAGFATTTLVTLPFIPLVFLAGRGWQAPERPPLEPLARGRR